MKKLTKRYRIDSKAGSGMGDNIVIVIPNRLYKDTHD